MTEIFENIRQLYTFCQPCEELADCIEFFSESSYEETHKYAFNEHFNIRMFPSWTPTFYINLGTPYHLLLDSKKHYVGADEDVLILRNGIAERVNHPNDHIFTVKFYPGGLETIFDINQRLFINKVVDLKNILPPALIDKVKRQNCFEGRVRILQDFFLKQYAEKKKQPHYIQFVKAAIDKHTATGMQFNTSEIAERMFTTSKTINRYFNNVIGTSPKSYFSIMRARAALAVYVADKKGFDPSIHGYYDMSHFYRDVKKFTNPQPV